MPTVTVTGLGETVRVASEPATMLTVAVPETLPEVAVTSRPAATLVGAVNTPLLSIVPPLVVQVGVTGTGLL